MLQPFFIEKLTKQYGEEITQKIIDAFSKSPYTTFRINTQKADFDSVVSILNKENIKIIDSLYNNIAIVLEPESESKVEQLDIYKDGKIYMQSLSSMIPPFVVEPKPKETILDMCAAPGGKTTQIAMLSKNEALITACERNTARTQRLKYNIEKQSAKGVCVMNMDARDLDDFFSFDKILLDAPCSGSGTLFKISGENFSEELIQKVTKTQISLLNKAIKLAKQNGEIVYSTCSILKEENEEIISKALEKYENIEIVSINNEELDNIPRLETSIEGTVCVMPSQMYEGFFIAKLRKKA